MQFFTLSSLLKNLLILLFLSFFAHNFIYTPDYFNYSRDWFVNSLYFDSDPFSRLIFQSIEIFDLPHETFIFLVMFLTIFIVLKIRSLTMALRFAMCYPVFFNSLITPRFFFAILLIYSVGRMIKRSKSIIIISLLTILAISTHLASGVFIPIIIFIYHKDKISFKTLLFFLSLLVFLIVIFYNEFIILFELHIYRTEHIGNEEEEKSRPYIHYITTTSILLLSHLIKLDPTIKKRYFLISFVVIFLSFFYYDLIISRIFHALGVLMLLELFNHIRTEFHFNRIFIKYLYILILPTILLTNSTDLFSSYYPLLFSIGTAFLILTFDLVFYLTIFLRSNNSNTKRRKFYLKFGA